MTRIRIDELSLRLPAGYHQRAPHLPRLVARELQRVASGLGAVSMGTVRVPALAVTAGAGDAELARGIAAAIVGQLRAPDGRSR